MSLQPAALPPERQAKRRGIIIQVPNFRIGMVIKLIQLMNVEMSQLIGYIEKYTEAEAEKDAAGM